MNVIEKITVKIARPVLFVLWIFTGIAGFVQWFKDGTQQFYWASGVIFGLLLMSMTTWVLNLTMKPLLIYLFDKFPRFELFLDRYLE